MHWISLLIPGQYTQLHVHNWLLVIPWCPSCICCSISPLSAGGTRMASPLRMIPSSTVIVSRWFQKGHRASGISLGSSGQPLMIVSARDLRSRSVLVSSCNEALLVSPMRTWRIVTSSSISLELSGAYLERVSARSISFPGQYMMVQSYPWSRRSIR